MIEAIDAAGEAGCVVVGVCVDVVGRIDGEEDEACGGGSVDVRRGFEVIGVCPLLLRPAGVPGPAERVVHHLLWGTVGAGHLANRLLCIDGCDAVARAAHGRDVTGRRQPDPVAKAKTRLQT